MRISIPIKKIPGLIRLGPDGRPRVWTSVLENPISVREPGDKTLNQKILGTCRISFGVYKEEFGELDLGRLADSLSSVRQTLIKNNEGLNKVLYERGLKIFSV